MSFRNWFKGVRAKAITVLGSLALILGVGASISVAATQNNETVETDAGSSSYKLVGYINSLSLSTFTYASSSASLTNGGTDNIAYIKQIYLTAGDVFKVTDNSTWLGWDALDSYSLGTEYTDYLFVAAQTNKIYNCNATAWNGAVTTGSWGTTGSDTYVDYEASQISVAVKVDSNWAKDGARTDIEVYKDGVWKNKWFGSGEKNAATSSFSFNLSDYDQFVFRRRNGDNIDQDWGAFTSTFNTYDVVCGDKNIFVRESGYYDIYVTNNTQVYIEKAKWTVTFDKQSGTGGTDRITTAVIGENMPTIMAPTRSHYEFKGYFASAGGSGTQYYKADGTSNHVFDFTTNPTLYAYWDDQITITYKHINLAGTSIASDTVSYHNKSANVSLASSPQDGYKFEGWWTNYDSTTHVFSGTKYGAEASYTLGSSSIVLFGQYIATGALLCGLGDDWDMKDAVVGVSAGTGCDGTDLLKFEAVSIAAADEFKIYQITSSASTPYGDDYAVFGTDAVSRFNISHDSSDSNIVCKAGCGGTYDIFFDVSSHYIFIYANAALTDNGYYLTGTNEFSKAYGYDFRSDKKMTESVGGNLAVLETALGTSISVGTYVQPVHYTWPRAVWYRVTSLPNAPTGWSINDGKAYYNGAAAGRFNFYLKSVTGGSSSGASAESGSCEMYIVDVSAIAKYGYLYIASDKTSDQITMCTKDASGNVVVDSQSFSSYSGVATAVNVVEFNGANYLYRIPIYNLRGASGGWVVTQVVYNDGKERTITGIPDSSSTPHVHAKPAEEGSAAADANDGEAARIVFELAAAIYGANHHSLCAVDKDIISQFKTDYAALRSADAGAFALLTAAEIETYKPDGNSYNSSSGPKITETESVSVETMYAYINAHFNTSTGTWSLGTFGPAVEESSPLTITLWIVLGAGLAGMAAIGTAYFVSKKKKRPQA